MHMQPMRTAVERGVRCAARMLAGKTPIVSTSKCPPVAALTLVSWHTETHSRRADEDARRARLCAVD